jgi:hypothetical protein
MSAYLMNQNFAQLNPVPSYKTNLPFPSSYRNVKHNMPTNFANLSSPSLINQTQYDIDNRKNKDYRNNNVEGFYEKYQQSSSSKATQNYDRARQATQGLFEKNEITTIFFSDENMKRIQKKIKEEIYKRTNGQYKLDEDQDDSDLMIVMRALYLDKCKNLPDQTVRQVKILNQYTVDYIVPDMITNIKQYFGYVNDINKPLTPMIRPMNVSSAGRKLLPSITTLWR